MRTKTPTFLRRLAVALTMTAMAVVAACSGDRSVTAPVARVDSGAASLSLGTLLGVGTTNGTCTPLALDTASADIGLLGGELRVGPHRLLIPPGALLQRTRITAIITGDPSNAVQFLPEGLRFVVPTALTMSYANCAAQPGLVPRIVYTTDLLQVLEILPGVNNPLQQTVTAPLRHFSRYAVAW